MHLRTTAAAVKFAARSVDIVAVPFSQVVTVSDGGDPYEEAFDPDLAVELLRDPVPALLHHDPRQPFGSVHVVGRDSGGLRAVMRAAATRAGDEALELADQGVLYPSIGFTADRSVKSGGVTWRKRIVLHEVSLVTFQAYPGAQVTGVRAAPPNLHRLHQAQGLMAVQRYGGGHSGRC